MRSTFDLDYEGKEPEDFEFSGLDFPIEDAMDMYFAWTDHGIMAVSGGYLDQPSQWIRTIRICRGIHGIKSHEVRKEMREKQDAESRRSNSSSQIRI